MDSVRSPGPADGVFRHVPLKLCVGRLGAAAAAAWSVHRCGGRQTGAADYGVPVNHVHAVPDVEPARAAVLSPDLAAALRSCGPDGERALRLLQDAAAVLAEPGRWNAPYEVAQSCCRNAIDSVLHLAPKDLPGIEAARRAVVDAAKAIAGAWCADGQVPSAALTGLAESVKALRGEEANPGGQRIRQIGYLVQQQTRQEMGLAEVEAVRNSWTRFYRDTSGVLHGSGTGPDESRALFNGVVAAFEQLFLGLPDRAERLRELALLEAPSPADADEIAMMTDPRAGAYFFRAAVSDEWLDLLPAERLLPESAQWPALPYLQRVLRQDPERVCSWVEANLEAVGGRGPGAVSTAVGLISAAGMTAWPLLLSIAKEHQDRHVLLRIGYWARDIDVAERTVRWVQVVEAVLRNPEYGARETWEAAQLLRAVAVTVHPHGQVRLAGDRLGVIIRNVVAGTLAAVLGEGPIHFEAEVVNDLTEVTLQDPSHSFAVAVMRSVLDIAREDAQLGVVLAERLRPLESKLAVSALRDRIAAVLLGESYEVDAVVPDRARVWWDTAIPLAGRIVTARAARADEFDFLALVHRTCPEEHLGDLAAAVRDGLGKAPTTEEVAAWRALYEASGEALPAAWRTAWDLHPILPHAAIEAWQPLLGVLQELTGGQAPSRPEPLLRIRSWIEEHGGLSAAAFAGLAAAEGPAAAVRELVGTAVPRKDVEDGGARAGLLTALVTEDPQSWAADVSGVVAEASDPALRAAYFNALHRALGNGTLPAPELGHLAKAAFAVRPAPEAAEAGAGQLTMVTCNLLHKAWEQGLEVEDEPEVVSWLQALVASWSRPRVSSADPLIDATAVSGGVALLSLMAWGLQHAHRQEAALPEPLVTVLDRILKEEPDDQALAVVGLCLSQLVHCAPAWADECAALLFAIDTPWRSARAWLRHGQPNAQLLARLDRAVLLDLVTEAQADPLVSKVAFALLDASEALGPDGTLLAEFAGRKGGPEAVSQVLSQVAGAVFRCAEGSPWPGRAAQVWEAALDCGLPPAALTGLGRFAYAECLDETRWLELTARTVEQQPVLEAAYRVAERAAGHPSSPQAMSIAAAMLEAPADRYHRLEIQRYAARVFAEAGEMEAPERERLRIALINSGAIEDAFGDTGPARKDA
ncbi:hypothetical protein ACIQU4_27670 [Streptomyces sp. NPDC090741]|uniref:hypothetical protein n=1 Tax=Streptomyces sp. NPDC090741 TaxID=3365967 RepID=UPI0038184DFE